MPQFICKKKCFVRNQTFEEGRRYELDASFANESKYLVPLTRLTAKTKTAEYNDKPLVPAETEDEDQLKDDLIEQVKARGGDASRRMSIATLRKKLEDLPEDDGKMFE